RHTRSKRDWSSDVCSSDLGPASKLGVEAAKRSSAAAPSVKVSNKFVPVSESATGKTFKSSIRLRCARKPAVASRAHRKTAAPSKEKAEVDTLCRRPRFGLLTTHPVPFSSCHLLTSEPGTRPIICPVWLLNRLEEANAARYTSTDQEMEPWLPTATSAARAPASATTFRTPTVALSVAGTRTSSGCEPWSLVLRSA